MRLHQMGFIFRQRHFFQNLSIGDNILLPALKTAGTKDRGVSGRIDDLLERFGSGHFADHGITEAAGGRLQETQSAVRCRWIQRCCSPMNPQVPSTRR